MSPWGGVRLCSRHLWLITLGLTGVRLWLAAWVPLGDDEGYYWVWSRHLAASYYDHPPLVAWWVALSTWVFGDSLLALRLPFVVCGTLSALALWALVAETTGKARLARYASLVLQIVPVFFVIGFMVIPDGPLVLCWLLAGRAALRFQQRPDRASAIALGLTLGAAMLSKYIATLLLLSLAAHLLLSPGRRHTRAMIAVLAIGLVMVSPVLWWNAGHHWASFRYQFMARHHGAHVDLGRLLFYLGSQALYLSPLLLVFVFAATLRVGPRRWDRGAPGEQLLWWLGAPTACVFLTASAVTDFKPNWAVPAYPTLVALAVLDLHRWRARAPRLAVGAGIATVALAVAFTALPAIHIHHPVIALPPLADPTVDMAGWPEIARRAQQAAAALRRAGRPVFFAAGRYQLASRLEFYLPVHPEVISLNPGRDAYDDWQDLERLRGRNAIFIASDRYPTPPERLIRCDSARVASRLVVAARRHEQFAVTIYEVWGFRPGPANLSRRSGARGTRYPTALRPNQARPHAANPWPRS